MERRRPLGDVQDLVTDERDLLVQLFVQQRKGPRISLLSQGPGRVQADVDVLVLEQSSEPILQPIDGMQVEFGQQHRRNPLELRRRVFDSLE